MISFVDGPARGQTLSLRRAPMMLRVVRSSMSDWDGLDQLNDQPKLDETIYVYLRIDKPTTYFVDYRAKGGGRRGHAGQAARYRFVVPQPPDDVMRSTSLWRQWCEEQRVAAEVPK